MVAFYNDLSMSLITRCPACKTAFRVVPDQLRISQGWVRCGQCAEIFDASAQLLLNPQAAMLSSDSALPPMVMVDAPSESVVADFAESRGDLAGVNVVAADLAATGFAANMSNVPAKVNGVRTGPVAAEETQLGADPAASAQTHPGTAGQFQDPWLDAAPALSDAGSAKDEATDSGIQAPEISFIKQGQTQSIWMRRSVKAVLCLVAIALTGGLAFQILLHERDRIAALYPSARAWIVSACRPLNCKVSPFRQIDAITIDASSFAKIRLDTYRLSVVLKNSAPYDLAAPALEMTLTDSQDQAVIRRVVALSEFMPAGSTILADSEWSGNMMINLRPGAGADRVSGYRVLAFYP